MIKKSLITALILLMGYHFVLPHLSRYYYLIPGQQRANYLRAQQYVHDTPSDANVIVGSSMANALSDEVIGSKYVKLTFPAGGSLTGLEIIQGTGKQPKVLWIESNTILKALDRSMVQDVLSPWRRKLRDEFLVFREEGRPSNFETGFLKALVGKICKVFSKTKGTGESSVSVEPTMDPAVLANIMKMTHESLSRVPAAGDLASRADRLGELVDGLMRRGTKCIFIEMPIDSSLKNLPEPVAVRTAMLKRFPAGQYHWFQPDRDHDYQTFDGVHLIKSESDKLTEKMLRDTDGFQ
ncbi:MAG: hypothetical protein ABI600_15540 [Luteolibacter sp.]